MQDKVNCTLFFKISKLLIKEELGLLNKQRMRYVTSIDWNSPGVPKRSIVSSPVVAHLCKEEADIPRFKQAIESLSKTELGFVRKLMGMATCCETIYITQTTLGKDVGHSSGRKEFARETANRKLKKLNGLGIIEVTNRGVKRSCLYRVSPLFFNKELNGFLLKFFFFLIGNLFPQSGYPQVRLYEHRVTQNDIYKVVSFNSEPAFGRWSSLLVTETNAALDRRHRKRTFLENREYFSIKPRLAEPMRALASQMGEPNSDSFIYKGNLLHPHADRVPVEDVDNLRSNSAIEPVSSANFDHCAISTYALSAPETQTSGDTIRMRILDGIFINKKEGECFRRNAPQAPTKGNYVGQKPYKKLGDVLGSCLSSLKAQAL